MANKSKKQKDDKARDDAGATKVVELNVGDTLIISSRFIMPDPVYRDLLREIDDEAYIQLGADSSIPAKRYNVIQSGTFSIRCPDDNSEIRIIVARPINTNYQVIA